MSKRQKPTLMILAGAVILAAVGTYIMLQNEQQIPEKTQSMNQTPEEEKSVTDKTESIGQDFALLANCNHTIESHGSFSYFAGAFAGGFKIKPNHFKIN